MTEQNARSQILDAAEKVFALQGFDGASMREIAKQAGVAQALLHYHFDSKRKLFESMFSRRSEAINRERLTRLDELFNDDEGAAPTLPELIDALFRPTVSFGHEQPGGNLFSRVLVSTNNADDQASRDLISSFYDPTAKRFISAIQRVVPSLKEEEAVWGYMFAIGVGMTMMATTGRAGRLSGGQCDDSDVEAMMARIVPFICAGINALAPATESPSR
ncbi:TetR/AcrR family transcriptional regulator [Pusillimonas noertemannii]|uniref:TetR family transcriptional regulator n=1 Tax=Pusillimonas noertemannii TaxID=305977 RepID=A0A2U1CSW5_9BURK|nr:TetR/AcrR family transcriptional regulator [Pusillimonas noertemannii]NYT70526.1 TetR/AcrR family transcriptional regulator [Pusillimonas noertemannii]PVY68963.1 TetR family transcriptional regulator [Pusillimonas noertemannii]TFL11595.1 TetR/AcrR family transcriptional regulator [Pusillimonas noertemannii]